MRTKIKPNVKTVMVISDLHAGSKYGLMHPKYTFSDKQWVINMRERLWNWFETRRSLYKPDILICNGDMIEGHDFKSGGTNVVTTNCHKQAEMAADIINHIGAKTILMTYGTPYHTGSCEDFEDDVAEKVGAKEIKDQGVYNINGLSVIAKHYIGNSSSPMSRFTALGGAEIKQMLWTEAGIQPKANLIIRSHIHRCLEVGDPDRNFKAFTTPALKGLGDQYGRQLDGLPISVGFVILQIESATQWGIIYEKCALDVIVDKEVTVI